MNKEIFKPWKWNKYEVFGDQNVFIWIDDEKIKLLTKISLVINTKKWFNHFK